MNCHHCHSPIADGIVIETGEKRFCCHACQAVAMWIEDESLQQYYQLRTAAAPKPSASYSEAHWQAYDAVAGQYVYQDADGSKEIHLYVDGIHCAACSWLIRAALQRQLHLDDVRVNVSTTRVEIRWRSEVLLSQILHTLAQIGYIPDVYQPDQSEKRFNQQRNQALLRLIIAALGSMQVMMFATGSYFEMGLAQQHFEQYLRWIGALLATPILFYSGYPLLTSAFLSLKNKKMNMDVPIVFALLGAYGASLYHTVLGQGEIYFDSVTMFVFFISLSRFIELLTRRRARLNEQRFAKLLPDVVALADGRCIPLLALQVGQSIRVQAAATVPADGIIEEGSTRVDESMLHGESRLVFKQQGERMLAGSYNAQSPIVLKVTQTGQDTVLAGLKRLIARAEQQRTPQVDQHQKIAEWSVIGVLILAAAGYLLWQWIDADRAFEIALAVLVATCPCALSLATPTALTAAINHAQKYGILLKDNAILNRLLQIKTLIFDKTGTLTQGQFQLLEAHFERDEALLWRLAKSLEQHSAHPLAWFFKEREGELETLQDVAQHTGLGVEALWQGQKIFIGSRVWAAQNGLQIEAHQGIGTVVYLFNAEEVWAKWVFADPLRPESASCIASLRPHYRLALASGDRETAVREVAEALQIEDYAAGLNPEEKLQFLEARGAESALMVGDGSNDAPVLARAAVSVAVRQASSLSQNHADIVLLQHSIEALPWLFTLARRTQQLIRQNLMWASAYNVLIVPLAVAGYLSPWLAALGMSLSSLLVVLNALRIHHLPEP